MDQVNQKIILIKNNLQKHKIPRIKMIHRILYIAGGTIITVNWVLEWLVRNIILYLFLLKIINYLIKIEIFQFKILFQMEWGEPIFF
jgi:hypothetical protein